MANQEANNACSNFLKENKIIGHALVVTCLLDKESLLLYHLNKNKMDGYASTYCASIFVWEVHASLVWAQMERAIVRLSSFM